MASYRNLKYRGITVSLGNSKLVGEKKDAIDSKKIMIYNTPSKVTCPGRTEMCSRLCYAFKAERLYIPVLPCRKANLEASLSGDFVENMVYIINRWKHLLGAKKLFRIHESGDFYSQKYWEKWVEIARRCPDVKFLAYTKSFAVIDFRYRPDNVSLIWSVMPDTNLQTVPTLGARAYAGDCAGMPKNTVECSGKCNECQICWKLNDLGLNVHFKLH